MSPTCAPMRHAAAPRTTHPTMHVLTSAAPVRAQALPDGTGAQRQPLLHPSIPLSLAAAHPATANVAVAITAATAAAAAHPPPSPHLFTPSPVDAGAGASAIASAADPASASASASASVAAIATITSSTPHHRARGASWRCVLCHVEVAEGRL